MNLATVWNLPAIFVGENNGYAEATSSKYSVACDNIADRAAHSACPASLSMASTSLPCMKRPARRSSVPAKGGGPTLLEVKLSRYYGHFEGDQQTYRAPGEVQNMRETKDCLCSLPRASRRAEQLSRPSSSAIDVEVKAMIDASVGRQRQIRSPLPADLMTDVYVSY
jgi:TPP-dependent pyruvate/acetoin dehydrogenase alpha subunit